jgi:hypothetical protein
VWHCSLPQIRFTVKSRVGVYVQLLGRSLLYVCVFRIDRSRIFRKVNSGRINDNMYDSRFAHLSRVRQPLRASLSFPSLHNRNLPLRSTHASSVKYVSSRFGEQWPKSGWVICSICGSHLGFERKIGDRQRAPTPRFRHGMAWLGLIHTATNEHT